VFKEEHQVRTILSHFIVLKPIFLINQVLQKTKRRADAIERVSKFMRGGGKRNGPHFLQLSLLFKGYPV
jgi:hypothetical protein